MDLGTCYRRRARNRPSIHPRFILVRQFRFKSYKQRRLAREKHRSARADFCSAFVYAFATFFGCLIAWSSISCYPASSGGALLSYAIYNSSSIFLNNYVLNNARTFFGLDGEYSAGSFYPVCLTTILLVSDGRSHAVCNRRQRRRGPVINVLLHGATKGICLSESILSTHLTFIS